MIDPKAFDRLCEKTNATPSARKIYKGLVEIYEAAKTEQPDGLCDLEGVTEAVCEAVKEFENGSRHTLGHHVRNAIRPYIAEPKRESGSDFVEFECACGWKWIESRFLDKCRECNDGAGGEDKLHELILRLARACDCATIVCCNSDDDKMLMLRIVEQARENIFRHTRIKGFIEIWLAKEFPDRYQLEQMPTTDIEDGESK